MSEFPVPRIADVKVDGTKPGATDVRPRITIEWTDSAGARQTIERHGAAATTIINELHAQTLMGEADRRGYLLGFIRCHTLRLRREAD